MDESVDLYVDAKGLSCPMPLLKAKQALSKLEKGQLLRLEATDSGSVRDFRAFIKLSNHEMVSEMEIDEVFRYVIRKG